MLSQVLVSMLDHTILTMHSLHSWIRSSRPITDTSHQTSTSHPWITTLLDAHHSREMKTE